MLLRTSPRHLPSLLALPLLGRMDNILHSDDVQKIHLHGALIKRPGDVGGKPEHQGTLPHQDHLGMLDFVNRPVREYIRKGWNGFWRTFF
jgi:hypothetical protein